MAIRHGYALVTKDRLDGKVHTTLTCGVIRDKISMVIVPVDDGIAKWRHKSRVAVWCEVCPPERDWSWQEQGACYSLWPAVDMVDMGRGHNADAKIEQYCGTCPVVPQCAAFALNDITETVGIWGGVFVPANVGGRNIGIRRKAIEALRVACGIVEGLEPDAA